VSALAFAEPPWKLVWADEFNEPAGSRPDALKWRYDLGGDGWGNRELETYTDAPENVSLDGQGHLVLRALKTSTGGYTSGRLNTKGKFEFRFGRVEARIRLPYGQGIWPAFWMLGGAIDAWPDCGEIDIMENIGKEPAIIHGTVHGPGYSGARGIGGSFELTSGARFVDDFHVYGAAWWSDRIVFLVDGKEFFRITPSSLPAGAKWVFDHPFYLVLNLAVGGNWPGYPDQTTSFPQTMLIDWVRVYEPGPR
jgi:beta-glucanase (GH16 family)